MAQPRDREDRAFIEAHKDELSDSTLRAQWITATGEHEERPGQTLATRKHDVIQQWAAEREARPATVPGSEHDGHPGVLRLDFPGHGGESLQHLDWSDWFTAFDSRDLVFLFQEHTTDGSQSNFFHLDSPHREDA